MSQAVGSSIGGLQGGIRTLTPPLGVSASTLTLSSGTPPLALALATGLAVVSIGLTTAAAIDANNAQNDLNKANQTLAEVERRLERARAVNPNTGEKREIIPPPFTGGQTVGKKYTIHVKYYQGDTLISQFDKTEITGAIGAVQASIIDQSHIPFGGITTYWKTQTGQGLIELVNAGGGDYRQSRSVKISVTPSDNSLDEGGNLLTPLGDVIKDGYNGNKGDRLEDRQQRKLGLPPSALGIGGEQGVKQLDRQGEELGTGFAPRPPQSLVPPLDENSKRLVPPPLITPPSKPPTQTPPPLKKDDGKKVGIPPTGIPPVDTGTATILGAIASGTATTVGLLNQVKEQTSPENQRLNSKNGSCDALNSPSCREGLKNDIVNPLGQKIDANALGQDAALGTIIVEQQAQKGVLATIAAKATDIFDLVGKVFNNSIIDKAMQYIILITTIHNAAMVSRGIGDTLGSALDNGLSAFGLQIKDKDGNQQSVTQIIGKSFNDMIKGVIGADNFTALNATWLNANRVYQAGINLLSNVQSIVDSATAVAEVASNRIGTLMNALRNCGGVREDAYGAQSQNVTRFNAFQNKLEALEQGASNTAAITGNIASVQASVNELKTNRTELDNAIRDESTKVQDTKTEKREESVFKISDFTIVRPPEVTE